MPMDWTALTSLYRIAAVCEAATTFRSRTQFQLSSGHGIYWLSVGNFHHFRKLQAPIFTTWWVYSGWFFLHFFPILRDAIVRFSPLKSIHIQYACSIFMCFLCKDTRAQSCRHFFVLLVVRMVLRERQAAWECKQLSMCFNEYYICK